MQTCQSRQVRLLRPNESGPQLVIDTTCRLITSGSGRLCAVQTPAVHYGYQQVQYVNQQDSKANLLPLELCGIMP